MAFSRQGGCRAKIVAGIFANQIAVASLFSGAPLARTIGTEKR
jgi:hypothetical protein